MTHPAHDFDAIYASDEPAPWDIGRPQPALAAAVERLPEGSRVLDAGCGTGETALFLAGRGHPTLGIDSSAAAIHRARAKAREHGGRATFEVADATGLGARDETFDAVVDSGLLHSLAPVHADAYTAGLLRVCRPGGWLLVLAIAPSAGLGWGLERIDLENRFAPPAWTDVEIAPTDVLAHVDGADRRLAGHLLTARRGTGEIADA